ncbi:hypothetical protein RYD26_12040 [Pasteurellaceae bacterium LIM206]|nr:hypothetical protein [Pasteurellaceae bacterium LIM206]
MTETPINADSSGQSNRFFRAITAKRLKLIKSGQDLSEEDQYTLLIGGKVRCQNGEFLRYDNGRLKTH